MQAQTKEATLMMQLADGTHAELLMSRSSNGQWFSQPVLLDTASEVKWKNGIADVAFSSEHPELKDMQGAVSAGPKGESYLVASSRDAPVPADLKEQAGLQRPVLGDGVFSGTWP